MKMRKGMSAILALIMAFSVVVANGTISLPTLALDEAAPTEKVELLRHTAESQKPYGTDSVSAELVDISADGLDVSRAAKLTVTGETFTGDLFIYPEQKPEAGFADVSQVMDTLAISAWVKLPAGCDGTKLRLWLGCCSWGGWCYGDVTVAKGGEWQQVTVKISDAHVDGGFDKTQAQFFKVTAPDGTGMKTGDDFYLAGLHLYYEKEVAQTEKVELLRHTAESQKPYGTDSVSAELVDISADGLDVSRAAKLTVTGETFTGDLFIYPEQKPEAGFADVSQVMDTLAISAWVKLPAGCDGTKLRLWLGCCSWGGWCYGDVTVAKGGEWQQVTVKISDAHVDGGFDKTQAQFFKVTAPDGTGVKTGDDFYLAGLHLYYEKEVAQTEKVELLRHTAESQKPYGTDSVSAELVDISADGLDVSRAAKLTVTGETFTGDLFIYPEQKPEAGFADVSQVMDTLAISAWVKLPAGCDGTKLRLWLGCCSWGGWCYGDVTVAKGGEWQQVTVKISDAHVDGGFDKTQAQFFKVTAPDGTGMKTGDDFYLAGLHLYYEKETGSPDPDNPDPDNPDNPDPDNPDPDQPDPDDPGPDITDPNYTVIEYPIFEFNGLKKPHLAYNGISMEAVTLTTGSLPVTTGIKANITDANAVYAHEDWDGYMFLYADSPEMAYKDITDTYEDLYVSFYLWLPANAENTVFQVCLGCCSWEGYGTATTEIKAGGQWTRVTLPVKDMQFDETFDKDQFQFVRLRILNGTGLKTGDVFYFTNVKVYTRELVPKKDLYTDTLTDYDNPYTAESQEIFVHSVKDPSTMPEEFRVETVPVSDDDRFTQAEEITLGTLDESRNWSLVLKGGDAVSLLDCYTTAALRLFVKAPRDNIRLDVGVVDTNGAVRKGTVLIEKAGVWTEIQVRIQKLEGDDFDRTALAGIYIGSTYKELFDDQFLGEGEKIQISTAAVWNNSPARLLTENVEKDYIGAAYDNYTMQIGPDYKEKIHAYQDGYNRMNDRKTWRLEFQKSCESGFEVAYHTKDNIDMTAFKNFGYMVFAVQADRYISMNLVFSDGTNQYSTEATASGEWMEYRVYLKDLIDAGVNVDSLQDVKLVRNRGVAEGCHINITELTLLSDNTDFEYVYSQSIPDGPKPPDNVPTGYRWPVVAVVLMALSGGAAGSYCRNMRKRKCR